MSVAHDVPWTAEQREWLAALGYDVLVPAGSNAATVMTSQPDVGGAPARPEHATRAPQPAATLLRALARAAGRAEDDSEFRQALPDLATLRGNPAARRALWPRLRALRRRSSR